MHYFSGVKSFWSVQNNQPVTDSIKTLNSRNKALSIAAYDFSILYTNIPHNKLKNLMRELIDFCFKGREKHFISVMKFGATWTVIENKLEITFDKAPLKLAINFLLDNFFFLILEICPFDKSLIFPWVLTQHIFWQNYFYIIMRINGY